MALYKNQTRSASIVTLRISAVQDPKKALEIGPEESAMKSVSADVGIHDLLVGPGESIELSDGVTAEFLAARGV